MTLDGFWIPRWIRVPFRTSRPPDVEILDVLIEALQLARAKVPA